MITLISETKTKNALGVYQTTLSYKDVFCNVSSVTAAEFFDGGQQGLKPEYRMTLFFGDYNGEEILEYNGKTYAIYRTYKRQNDSVELYVERKGGTNGKEQTNQSGTASGSH